LKQSLISATHWYVAVYFAILLFFLEIILAVVSFPLYFLVSPQNIQKAGCTQSSDRKHPCRNIFGGVKSA